MDEDTHSPAGSDAPSDASNFYDTTAPLEEQAEDAPAVAPDHPVTNQPVDTNGVHSAEDVDGDDVEEDSSSEMDVSASSREASPEIAPEEPSHAGSKRKVSDAPDTLDAFEQALEDHHKKRKISPPPPITTTDGHPSPAERLPTEYWQQIFLRLSPAMLSRCLRVNKSFHTILTRTKASQSVAKKGAKKVPQVRVLDSEYIWSEARKLYLSSMPRPLMDRTELEMLQLIGGRTCQYCRRPPMPAAATSPFNAGPGADGMRVIWPFGIRTCGQCWEHNTLKDVDLLVGPASALRWGLAYAFRTPDLHFVPEIQRQLPGGIPSHLRVAKVHYKPDVQTILEEFTEIKGYGEGTADEWQKGLGNRGKEKMADAARWERWEQQIRGGHGQTDLALVLREYDLPSFPRYVESKSGHVSGMNGVNGSAPQGMNGTTHHLPQAQLPPPPFYNPYQNGQAYGFASQPPPPGVSQPFQHQQPRHFRAPQEVEAARAARKLEIERRCMAELQPPLEPSVLQHIESFQAAMQITTSLNDAQWEVLKPRLLAQREGAEMIEWERKSRAAALGAAIPSVTPREELGHVKKTANVGKDSYDREYEEAQEPLRKRLAEYVDEISNGGQGLKLDRDSAPAFAVRAIMHVRKRYLEDRMTGNLPTTKDTVKKEQGTPTPEPFLSLDNMKWLYDNKVRPQTDAYRRELFICAGDGCVQDKRPKWFAFEGLIQHYGAKHTSNFSKGNIVVHWPSAEWPMDVEEQPFVTDVSPWVKAEGRKGGGEGRGQTHGRQHRGTPQQHHAGHEGPFGVPASPGVLLSENPLFQQQGTPPGSNGHYPGGQGHQQGLPQRNFSSFPTHPPVDMSYGAQLTKLSSDARQVWDALDGVKDLLESVRMQTVLHHVVARFSERFQGQTPDLDLITDALATNVLMRPLKNAHGLACKPCVAEVEGGYFARIRGVKTYNASSLITHFKIVHLPQQLQQAGGHGQGGVDDRTTSMIELPEPALVAELLQTPGMDDEKLSLVSSAFPAAFPDPLPTIGVVTEPPPPAKDVGPDSGLAKRLLGRFEKKNKPGKKAKTGQHAGVMAGEGRDETSDSELPEPGEDEYDPRKPSLQEGDPLAKFDSDVARKTVAAAVGAGSGVENASFGLAPETLAVLNNLTSAAGLGNGRAEVKREERSPSVGRAEPLSAGGAASAPDISAILASLTGHLPSPATATPPAPLDSRYASTPRAPPPSHAYDPTHTYAHASRLPAPPHDSPAAYQRPDSSRRYLPAEPVVYRGSVEPSNRYSPLQVQEEMARNGRGYEMNQQHHQQHVPASYAQEAPAYTQQPRPQPQRSPPRYQYLYEDEQQARPPVYGQQQQTMYRDAPGVQYIQLPPEHSQAPPAQYPAYDRGPYQQQQQPRQPMPPRPMYVDEYGRPVELIPIDAAPAPVQYAAHPYDQQHYQARPYEQQQYAAQAPVPVGYGQQEQQYPQVVYEPQAPGTGGM